MLTSNRSDRTVQTDPICVFQSFASLQSQTFQTGRCFTWQASGEENHW